MSEPVVPSKDRPASDDGLRVAVLGQGSIGRRHATLLVEAGCEVRAWDPDTGTASPPGVNRVGDMGEALRSANAAIVASPTSFHLDQALEAVRHGCHVLVEKPIAARADGVAELLSAARGAGRLVAVGCNLRFHPGPSTVRDVVRSGRIGSPLVASVTFGGWLPAWRPGSDYRLSYSANAAMGGGIALDSIHEVDYAAWILGPATHVTARFSRRSKLEIDVEDVALMVLEHASGALSTVTLDYLDRSYRRGCRIVGEDASVEWSWREECVELGSGDGVLERIHTPSDPAATYREQLGEFVSIIQDGRHGESRLASGEDGLHALRIIDAARASSNKGRRLVVLW